MIHPGVSNLFSMKSQIVDVLDFMCHTVSVTATQPDHCGTKAAM